MTLGSGTKAPEPYGGQRQTVTHVSWSLYAGRWLLSTQCDELE